jgi:hypothetical protein
MTIRTTIPVDDSPESTGDLFDQLRAMDFGTNGVFFDKGNVRVALDDTDIVVYRFVGNGVLSWTARFNSRVPTSAIIATVQAGLA